MVRFPITVTAAKLLIKTAKPAKFGRREKTLYDPNIRDVWEIPKEHIKIATSAWSRTIDPVLKEVKKNLNLPIDGRLTAELHNMLLYEPGQFFSGHQDSEKTDKMVATLVILLPSQFSGGSLVIDQHGDKQKLNAPKNSAK